MADETPDTTQPPAEPVTEQTPPAVVVLYDAEGREHYTSPRSPFAVDGLADGSLTEQAPASTTEEAASGAQTGSAGDDQQPGSTDGNDGSDNRSADPTGTGDRRRTGKA